MVLYIAFEAFTMDHKFAISEVCIVDDDGQILFHEILRQRFKFSHLSYADVRTNKFLAFKHHFILWDDWSSQLDFPTVLMKHVPVASHVIVKGCDIASYIKMIRDDVIIHNVDDMIPKLDKNIINCSLHYKHTLHCAKNKALYLYKRLNKH